MYSSDLIPPIFFHTGWPFTLAFQASFSLSAFVNTFSLHLSFSVTPLDPDGLLAMRYAIPASNVCTYFDLEYPCTRQGFSATDEPCAQDWPKRILFTHPLEFPSPTPQCTLFPFRFTARIGG